MSFGVDTARILHGCGCDISQAAVAPTQPLAWELPNAVGAALESKIIIIIIILLIYTHMINRKKTVRQNYIFMLKYFNIYN